MTRLKLDEMADRIEEHLRRFERTPEHNPISAVWRTQRFYQTRAVRVGARVSVCYVSYQGGVKLSRDRAEAYLAWLDAGNVGTHWECERALATPPAPGAKGEG